MIYSFLVIPAEAGIFFLYGLFLSGIPAFAGMTNVRKLYVFTTNLKEITRTCRNIKNMLEKFP